MHGNRIRNNGIKRKKPLVLDWENLLPTASGDEDHPPEFVVTSNKKSKVGCSGEDAQENQKEFFELLMKTDHEISEYITRHTKTMSILSESLPDKGQRLKTALRRHEDELQRRKKLQSENQKEDLELRMKSDNEINEFIARHRKNISILSVRLPDKGQRLKAALQRHEDELQRRKKLQSEKGHNECEETILVSDDIDGGASCGKKNGDQKSLSSSTFAKLFYQKFPKHVLPDTQTGPRATPPPRASTEGAFKDSIKRRASAGVGIEPRTLFPNGPPMHPLTNSSTRPEAKMRIFGKDKDSRTVNACQGGKVKPNSQLERMEANPSRPHHPSSNHCPTEPSSPTQPVRSQHDDKDFTSWRSQMRSEIHCLRSDFQDLQSDFIAYQEAGDIRFTRLQDMFAEIRYELRRQASNGFDR